MGERLKEPAERQLDDRDYLVVYLDGIQFRGHHVLATLGVDNDGNKRMLGLQEGASQNTVVALGLLETRPIFHRIDAAICGHVFCSFLALKRELLDRIEKAGIKAEWDDVLRDLRTLAEAIRTYEGKRFPVRSRPVGVVGKLVQCRRIRLPVSYAGPETT